MRIVDADDAVNRFEELKPKGSSLDVRYAYGVSVGLEMAKHVIMSELSTVDAVPVVRCKDCKHKHYYQFPPKYDTRPYCDKHEKVVTEHDYCSYGERKDGEQI